MPGDLAIVAGFLQFRSERIDLNDQSLDVVTKP
jgi:hypothetical protein